MLGHHNLQSLLHHKQPTKHHQPNTKPPWVTTSCPGILGVLHPADRPGSSGHPDPVAHAAVCSMFLVTFKWLPEDYPKRWLKVVAFQAILISLVYGRSAGIHGFHPHPNVEVVVGGTEMIQMASDGSQGSHNVANIHSAHSLGMGLILSLEFPLTSAPQITVSKGFLFPWDWNFQVIVFCFSGRVLGLPQSGLRC